MTTTNLPADSRFYALLPLIGTALAFAAMLVVVTSGAATAMLSMM